MSFLDLLHEKLSDIDLEVASLESTPVHNSKKRYYRYMRDCYDSLGRYVSKLQIKKSVEQFVQIEYLCLLMPLPTLKSMVRYFMKLQDPIKVLENLVVQQIDNKSEQAAAKKPPPELEILQRRIRDLALASQRLEEFAKENTEAATCQESNVFIMFGKKRASFSLEKILKNSLSQAEKLFTSTLIENNSMCLVVKEDLKRRQELMESLSAADMKLVNLLKDYLRNIDLNYIDASRSYYNEKFTFTDLLRRDKVNKKFTRVEHINMGGDSGPQYSAELAAEYLLHKIDELKEDIVLVSKSTEQPKVDLAEPPELDETDGNEDETEVLPILPFPVINSIGRLANLVEEDPFSFNSDSTHTPGMTNTDSKLLSMLDLIMTDNRVITEYLKKLSSALSKSKTFLDSRYIHPFDSSIKYGQTVLEQIVAYRFTENMLNSSKGLGFKISETSGKIDLVTEEDIQPPQSSLGLLEYTKSSVLGQIVILSLLFRITYSAGSQPKRADTQPSSQY